MPDISLSDVGWFLLISVATGVVSVVGVGWALVRLPADYFTRTLDERREYLREHWVWFIARNALGILILVAGVILLFMPGQGLLAILVGVLLVDFPGKRIVIRKIIARKGVMSTANWLRARFGRPPFEHPE